MKLKPVYLCVIQEKIGGTLNKEFLHIISNCRLSDLIGRRNHDGQFYYKKDIRDLAVMEVERREHNSLVEKAIGEIEFREEVIAAMVDAGVSRHVAENMTSGEAKMMGQARKYGII
jgi:hypothetical protein